MKTTVALMIAALLPVAAGAQTTTYTGPAGGNITTAANWSAGLPTSANPGEIGISTTFGTAILDGYVFNLSQTLTRVSDFIPQFKNCNITVKSGGNLNVTVPTNVRATRLQGNTTITIETGGQFTAFTNRDIELQSGAVTGAQPGVLVNGGALVAGGYVVQASVLAEYAALGFGPGSGTASLSSLTFDPLSTAYVNFLTGSNGQLAITGKDQAFYEGLWASGRLRVDGLSQATISPPATPPMTDYFTVTGNVLTLKGLADPAMQVLPSSITTSTNGAGITGMMVTVTNLGETQSLDATLVSVTGPDQLAVTNLQPAAGFSVTPNGGTQQITFDFTPLHTGIHTFSLEIESNDQQEISPRIVPVIVDVREPLVAAVSGSLDFGIFATNPAPLTRAITVTNTSDGSLNLNVTGTTVTGDTGAFQVTSVPGPLAPGASGDVVVTFDPGSEVGAFGATVTIQSDDYTGAEPAFTFKAYVETAATPAARVDFGSATTPVQSGYTQFVAAEDATLSIEGLTLTLDSKDGSTISRDLGATYGALRQDAACTPGVANGEYLRVVITGLQTGALNLVSSHQKAEGVGPQVESVLFGEVGGTLATVAAVVSRGDWVEYSVNVEAGKTYELRMLEASTNNSAYISSLVLWGSAVPGTSSQTPYEGWASANGLNPAWQTGDDPATDGRPEGDPDNDSFTNHQEFLFGTPPDESNGSLASVEQSGSNLLIRWKERADATYRLTESTTLADPWVASSAPVTDDGVVDVNGYQPRLATVPVGPASLFLRVEGEEN